MIQKADKDKRLNELVANAKRQQLARERGYREQALKLYPWICTRCCREFDQTNLQELTVHHRDHNHDNNPTDGSYWELLCIYCHDHEHSKYGSHQANPTSQQAKTDSKARQTPFDGLAEMLKKQE